MIVIVVDDNDDATDHDDNDVCDRKATALL